MVRWYHAIFSAYGFWLPNDPRGSWSDFIHAYDLFRAGGPATTVSEKRSYAHDPHDGKFRRSVKEHLRFPSVRFNGACRNSISKGFHRACTEYGFLIHACAIGFDHVHLVASRDAKRSMEQVVAVLKAHATMQMNSDRTHPMEGYRTESAPAPTPWGKGCWSVFIDNETQLRSAIGYVKRHPVKEGLKPQDWNFITPV